MLRGVKSISIMVIYIFFNVQLCVRCVGVRLIEGDFCLLLRH